MWVLYAFGSAFFAGITAIVAKIAIKNTDSTLTTAIRTVVVLLFAWIMTFIVGSYAELPRVKAVTWVFLTLSGIATGASWLCYFRALQLGDVNKVVPVDKSSTVLTVLLAFIFLGESVTWAKGIGVAAIAVGTYLMIDRRGQLRPLKENKGNRWLVYALLSAVFAALTAILGKVGIEGVESNLGTAIRTGVVLVMSWAIVFATGKHKGVKKIGAKEFGFICLSGATTGASWLCYYKALHDGPASVVVPIDKLGIIVTVAFSYFIFKEKLSAKATIGLILLTAGTVAMIF